MKNPDKEFTIEKYGATFHVKFRLRKYQDNGYDPEYEIDTSIKKVN